MTRREELNKIFENVDESEKKLIDNLLDEVVFLENQMAELKKMKFISVHPKNPALQKKTEAAKLYKEDMQSYMNAIRILVGILHKIDKDAESELLEKLNEFE